MDATYRSDFYNEERQWGVLTKVVGMNLIFTFMGAIYKRNIMIKALQVDSKCCSSTPWSCSISKKKTKKW